MVTCMHSMSDVVRFRKSIRGMESATICVAEWLHNRRPCVVAVMNFKQALLNNKEVPISISHDKSLSNRPLRMGARS